MNTTSAVRLIAIHFNNALAPSELPLFRSGIIESVGSEHLHFHNYSYSDAPQSVVRYRYPLIQYRHHRGTPQLLCLQEGVEAVQALFSRPSWQVRLGARSEQLGIKTLKLKNVCLQPQPHDCRYRLRDWLALDAATYDTYKTMSSLIERVAFLEQQLTKDLTNFVQAVSNEPLPPESIAPQIVQLTEKTPLRHTVLPTFNLHFKVKLKIPFFVGLGYGASLGYGRLLPKNN